MASAILRPNAEALIPEDVIPGIIQGTIEQSAVLSTFRRLPNMASNISSMAVLESLPMSYWVNGDIGLKQTTNIDWKNKYLKAAELATIVPIPDAVLEDARDTGTDIFAELQPLIVQSMGKAIDLAILFSINAPPDWRDGIVQSAENAGNVVTDSGDMFEDIFGENGALAKVEASGFEPSGIMTDVATKGRLRGLRDTAGQPIFITNLQSSPQYSLYDMALYFVRNGAWQSDIAKMIIGDFEQAVYSIRKDITYKILTESVITDADGKIVFNLAQQDMTALRVVMRLGWEVPNPINALSPNRDERFPFSVYKPGGGMGGYSVSPTTASTKSSKS